jgi:hypothetical protein
VEQDTDPNDDVCLTFLIHTPQVLVVRLSLVGRYALVQGLNGGDELDRIQRLLAHYNVRVLTEGLLAAPVPLRLNGRSEVSVYQALFEPEADGELGATEVNGD